MSTDGTPDRLRELGVHVIETKKIQGVTANWNMVRRHLKSENLHRTKPGRCAHFGPTAL